MFLGLPTSSYLFVGRERVAEVGDGIEPAFVFQACQLTRPPCRSSSCLFVNYAGMLGEVSKRVLNDSSSIFSLFFFF